VSIKFANDETFSYLVNLIR